MHDARLVAVMEVYGIQDLLTLNERDIARYAGIRVHLPDAIAPAQPTETLRVADVMNEAGDNPAG